MGLEVEFEIHYRGQSVYAAVVYGWVLVGGDAYAETVGEEGVEETDPAGGAGWLLVCIVFIDFSVIVPMVMWSWRQ